MNIENIEEYYFITKFREKQSNKDVKNKIQDKLKFLIQWL